MPQKKLLGMSMEMSKSLTPGPCLEEPPHEEAAFCLAEGCIWGGCFEKKQSSVTTSSLRRNAIQAFISHDHPDAFPKPLKKVFLCYVAMTHRLTTRGGKVKL